MNGNFILGHAAFYPYRIPVGQKPVKRRIARAKRVAKVKRKTKGKR